MFTTIPAGNDVYILSRVLFSWDVVSCLRGQQLKDQVQLNGWLRDGSAAWVEELCEWG